MIGAMIGDMVGSVYEWRRIKHTEFPLFGAGADFTDDTVMTAATARALMDDGDFARWYRHFGRRYPGRGYGGMFAQWLELERMGAYNSWGNGSAMRVSPVGFACETVEQVLAQARQSAEVTHDHPEGIKGAQAAALAVFLARTGSGKEDIREQIGRRFGYDLQRTVADIRPAYTFNESCQETVPEAIVAFLDSTDFESAIRLAVSLGGDSDTLACIAGGIAQAYYRDIPAWIMEKTLERLPSELRDLVGEFESRYHVER
jgi:ADP-ribosylglycohydrolase